MNIPFLDLKAQYRSIKQEVEEKILEVIATQKFILGPEVEQLEKEIAAYTGVSYGIGVSSGSDALIVSLMALGVGQGDAVVTTPFTFFATAGAIVRVGARPVFVDIQRDTFNMDPAHLEKVLDKVCGRSGPHRVKGIIPVHLFGQCADMAPILEQAEHYGIPVVEDGAQAIGSEYPAPSGVKRANALGDLGILSFFPSKNLGGFGDGGMVLTDREDLSEAIRLLRVHGAKNKYYHDRIGGNFRLDNLQAAILRVKLRHLDRWIAERQQKASTYDGLFEETGLTAENLVEVPETVYRESGVPHYHTFHQYVIRVRERDGLQAFLKDRGVATAVYYPLALHLQKCFSDLGYRKGDFPESEKAMDEVLALPVYPELQQEQQGYIVSSIEAFYRKRT
ncbi:MAG: DegT/DnrJ/EryC1/StrS family aminotransferase [Candidatus Aminicenantales bacterium]